MTFDYIEWDEANLDHATRRATDAEIEQAIWKARSFQRHRKYADRMVFKASTDGGRILLIIAVYDQTRGVVRPITAWEEK